MQATLARVEESAAWSQLMERYQGLTPNVQKLSLAGAGALGALLLFMFPWIFFSSSQTSLMEFEDKKQLIRDLYRYSHAASTLPMAPIPVSAGDLHNAIQSVLGNQSPSLLPEQTVAITDFDNSKAKSAALAQGLTQNGVMVSLSRLNVDQLVKIGSQLQDLRPTVKMVGLKVQATAADPHYFDVTFKMVAFSLPPADLPKPGAKGSPTKPTGAKTGE
jgi:hypothetical protein